MHINKIELNENEKAEILMELYNSFKTGFDFEAFLKPLLEKIGLDEVRVTKRTRDGGVDLEGIRYGVISDDEDSVRYVVQAKRYKPERKISPDKIDALRGNMTPGSKGIFIATCGFTEDAKSKAASFHNDRPLLLIDGMTLVDICIEYDIGFVYKPVYSLEALESFYKIINDNIRANNDVNKVGSANKIVKSITANDIRARILRIPRAILDLLPEDKETFKLSFNGNIIENVRISADRRYFSQGVSEMYKKYNLLTQDNTYNPARSIWIYKSNIIYVDLI